MPTSISWVDETWNPISGCSPASPGCDNCYARKIAERLHKLGHVQYPHGFQPDVHEDVFDRPGEWKSRKRVLVCSMGDLFHEAYIDELIGYLFGVMRNYRRHTFCVLSKRPRRMVDMGLDWGDNIWAGVSVESQGQMERVLRLRQLTADVRFASFEPLIGPVELPPDHGLSWAICGGENGASRRPMELDWARCIRDQCVRDKVPFWYKGPGGLQQERDPKELDGVVWAQSPAAKGHQSSMF